jgi:TrmH family RNA methyltransferase
MEIITSKSNGKIAEAKKLLEKKFRDSTGLFLIETKKVIIEALSAGLKPKCLFVLSGKPNIFNDSFDCVYEVSERPFKEISTSVSTDGYVAIFEKKQAKKEYVGGKFLILDTLQNPDNFGAILRSAAASGFNQIFAINSVDEYSPKTIRASMGNQFKLNIVHIMYEDIGTMFCGAELFSANMNGKNIFEIENFPKNVGFVIGNEGNGISENIKKYVSKTVSIPMENGVESLNAGVSASIIMYHIYSHTK